MLKHLAEIDTLIFVSAGMDIFPHPENLEMRQQITAKLRKVAQDLGKEFIEVEASIQNFTDSYVNWDWCHGLARAAISQLLSSQFRKVYFASNYACNNIRPNGSHPLLDPLWSTEKLEIVHDGCEANRILKVGAISNWQLVLDNLRICLNYGENREFNCGYCEKCVRTMAMLHSFNVLERCPVLPHTLPLDEISRWSFKPHVANYWGELLQKLEEDESEFELQNAIRSCLANSSYNEGAGKIQALEKKLSDYERLFIQQRAWTRELEDGKQWLTEQLENYRAVANDRV